MDNPTSVPLVGHVYLVNDVETLVTKVTTEKVTTTCKLGDVPVVIGSGYKWFAGQLASGRIKYQGPANQQSPKK